MEQSIIESVIHSGFNALVGVRHHEGDKDQSSIALDTTSSHGNHNGVIAGGVIVTLLDTVAGCVARQEVGFEVGIVTTDLATQYWRSSVVGDQLVARGELVCRTGSSLRIEATVSTNDCVVAKAFTTYVVVKRR